VFGCDTAIGSNTACLSVPTLGTQAVFLIFHGREEPTLRGRSSTKVGVSAPLSSFFGPLDPFPS